MKKVLDKKKSGSTQDKFMKEMVKDTSVPASDRGDMLIFTLGEHGVDCRETVHELVNLADLGREYAKKKEAEGTNPLVTERFISSVSKLGRTYALVTRGTSDVMLPADPEVVADLQTGQRVLIDAKEDRIVGADGHLPETGDIARIVSRPKGMPDCAILDYEGRSRLARLKYTLLDDPASCQPDMDVVYDPHGRFATASISTSSDGDELLADLNSLETIRRDDVGSPKPVIDEILDRIRCMAEHPEWCKAVTTRQRTSYMFVGGTGTGKSFSLKLLVSEMHDMVEQLTGERSSRVVMLDCSDLWASYFGETESRIARWADKLQSLGSRAVRDKDGKLVNLPILVVLEECESLLRGRGEVGSGHLYDRALALFLKKTESLESALQAPIIWIATSNRPDLCDPAALRRVGVRQVTFGSLSANEALAVLGKKLHAGMPIRGSKRNGVARDTFLRQVTAYLYGPAPAQPIAEVHLGNGEHRMLNRSDVVTPAVLEEAVSFTADRCLRKSHRAGRMIGLDANDMVGYLHRHFNSVARTLRPHNVAEHCADWYSREQLQVTRVISLADQRRPELAAV